MGEIVDSRDCRDARELLSLALDEEPGPFQALRLERRLRGCASCCNFGAELEAITNALRSAPLERPQISLSPALFRRRRMLRGGTAVAAVAASLCLGLLQGSIGAGGGSQTPLDPVLGLTFQAPIAYAIQPQAQLP